MSKRFTIALEGEASFEIKDLWPDGDGPEKPTTDDVIAKIREDYGDRPYKIASELGIGLKLLVDGKVLEPDGKPRCYCEGFQHRPDCPNWEMCL